MPPSHKKYLHVASSIRRINQRYKLHDPKAVWILEAVLVAHADDVKITVLDLILLKEIASQATLHAVMKSLVEYKLIKTEVSKEDARRKYVLPAKLGLAWLNECSEVLCPPPRKSVS